MESLGVAWRPTDYILVTIRITIRTRESVPDHDPDPGRTGVRRRSVLSEYFRMIQFITYRRCEVFT